MYFAQILPNLLLKKKKEGILKIICFPDKTDLMFQKEEQQTERFNKRFKPFQIEKGIHSKHIK